MLTWKWRGGAVIPPSAGSPPSVELSQHHRCKTELGFYKQALADAAHLAMLKTFVFTGRILAHYLIIDCVYLVK